MAWISRHTFYNWQQMSGLFRDGIGYKTGENIGGQGAYESMGQGVSFKRTITHTNCKSKTEISQSNAGNISTGFTQ